MRAPRGALTLTRAVPEVTLLLASVCAVTRTAQSLARLLPNARSLMQTEHPLMLSPAAAPA
jgi:hypothetical protein